MISYLTRKASNYLHICQTKPLLVWLVVLPCILWTGVLLGLWFTGASVHYGMRPVIFQPNIQNIQPRNTSFDGRVHGRHKADGRWIVVSSRDDFYIYSAFYDDRRSLGTLPVVRVIGVSGDMTDRIIYCVLYFTDSSTQAFNVVTVEVTAFKIGAGVPYRAMLLIEYIYSCAVDSEEVPYQVAIIMRATDKPHAILPIEVPVRRPRKYDFVLCMSVTYWYHDPYHIIEWMEILQMWGVSQVVIYNNSLAGESASVFQFYDTTVGFVDFRQSQSFVDGYGEAPIHMHMSPVINDCMYRNMHSFKKVIVTDMDELIVPRQHGTYGEMLQAVDMDDPSNHPARSYTFDNDYFFLDLPVESNETTDLITLHHQMRMPASHAGYACKTIVDPQSCVYMHNHFCWGHTAIYENGDHVLFVDKSLGLNHHYKQCHFDDFEDEPGKCEHLKNSAVHDNNMMRFKTELQKRVNEKIKILNLKPISYQ